MSDVARSLLVLFRSPQVEAIFDEFDADGNGTVDASEMKALIASDPDFVSLLFSGSHVMKAASAEEQARVIQVSVLLCTVTFYADLAHSF